MGSESIYDYLARLVPLSAGRVLDVGCGQGSGLSAIGRWLPNVELVGVDRKQESVALARVALEGHGHTPQLVISDLRERLPFDDEAFDCVVCHNVLECLPEPVGAINEMARVLRRGGEGIISHTDFGTVVFGAVDPTLTTKALSLYASTTPSWTPHSNARLGRQLPALVQASALEIVDVAVHTTLGRRFVPGEKAYERATQEIAPLLSADERERWLGELHEMAANDSFLFSETAYVVRVRNA